MKNLKITLCISLLLNILLLIILVKEDKNTVETKVIAKKSEETPAKVIPQVKSPAEQRKSQFATYKSTKEDIVFIGDSLVEGGAWSEFYPGKAVRNRGIGGNRTVDVLDRLDSVLEGTPKEIFFLVGINDLIGKTSETEFIINYRNIIQKVKVESPDTEINIISLLPINEGMVIRILAVKSGAEITTTNQDIDRVNAQLKGIALNNGVNFINAFSQLYEQGIGLNEQNTYDGLHLSYTGYDALSKVLEPYIND